QQLFELRAIGREIHPAMHQHFQIGEERRETRRQMWPAPEQMFKKYQKPTRSAGDHPDILIKYGRADCLDFTFPVGDQREFGRWKYEPSRPYRNLKGGNTGKTSAI